MECGRKKIYLKKNYHLLFKIVSSIISLEFFLLFSVHNVPTCLSTKMEAIFSPSESFKSSNFTLPSAESMTRKKRQSADVGGGGSTSVIGARIAREATAGDWLEANFAVNNDAPATTRGKRSIVNNWYDFKKFQSTSTPFHLPHPQHQHRRRQRPLTRTQELFSCVNQDYYYAQRYQASKTIQGNSVLRKSIVLDHHGVKCGQVCDPIEGDGGVGFGLLGLCTDRYCRCDDQTTYRKHVEYICPVDQVFDPVTLWCQHPSDSILCSDPQPLTLIQIWTAGGPNFAGGWKKWK